MFKAYILKSEKDGTYYYGSTKDLTDRIKYHNSGKVRYTKSKRPWKIHYFEDFDNRSDAAKREMFWKTVDGYRWLKENSIT